MAPESPTPAPRPGLGPPSVVRALTSAGKLCYLGWLLFFFRQVERVVRVSPQQFAGVWDQRLEVLSFIVLPPNILVLVPAAACAAAATWLAGPSQELDLAILLRLVRWTANLQAVIALTSAVSVVFNDTRSPTQVGDVAIRIGAFAFAVAISRFCRAAGATAPGG